jgi:hypothetical protein
MVDPIPLEGSIELIQCSLTFHVPLSVASNELAPLAPEIAQVEGEYLCAIIKACLVNEGISVA